MRPKAIIFDVDGTLYDAGKLRLLLLSRFAFAHCFHPAQAAHTLKILRAYRRAHEELRRENCRITGPETQLAATGRLLRADPENLAPVLDEWFHRQPLSILPRCLRPGLIPLLDAAKSAGVRIAAYSDYPCREKLDAMRLTGYFEFALDPSTPLAGFLKPDPTGLRRALEIIGADPGKAVYIGDRHDLDGEAARRAGMRSLIVGAASFPEIARMLDL